MALNAMTLQMVPGGAGVPTCGWRHSLRNVVILMALDENISFSLRITLINELNPKNEVVTNLFYDIGNY